MTIRTGTARTIVLYLKLGYSLGDAIAAAVAISLSFRADSLGRW